MKSYEQSRESGKELLFVDYEAQQGTLNYVTQCRFNSCDIPTFHKWGNVGFHKWEIVHKSMKLM